MPFTVDALRTRIDVLLSDILDDVVYLLRNLDSLPPSYTLRLRRLARTHMLIRTILKVHYRLDVADPVDIAVGRDIRALKEALKTIRKGTRSISKDLHQVLHPPESSDDDDDDEPYDF